ncbi:MAG: hypothetical protein IKR69_07520 [Bacteroidales bacterium]|nr:hypothetical protein [Bacteroidales bacterium]
MEMTGSYAPEVKLLTSDGEPLAPSPFDEEKIAGLSSEELETLSKPVDYSGLNFETEVYRSGRHHIKKTRYKANPFGKVAGTHEGAQFYTIGQRKGLAVGGHKESLFVIATDPESNRVYVGEGHSHKGLYRHVLKIAPDEVKWLREELRMQQGDIRRYRVRVRYRQPLQSATLTMRESGMYILFDKPQRGIAPGQFAVWYEGDILRGSGPISR